MYEPLNAQPTSPVSEKTRKNHDAQYARVRHELCTPLSALIGYSEMLIEEAEEEQILTLLPILHEIRTTGEHLLTQVNRGFDPIPVNVTAWVQFREELRPTVQTLCAESERLIAECGQTGQAQFCQDAQKILAGALEFVALLNQADVMTYQEEPLSAEVVPTREQVEHPERLLRSGMLLVVDDNLMNRDLLKRYLEFRGHAVKTAENGQKALDLLTTQSFDVILLDILMPRLNGIQVLERLKRDPLWREIPVLMISAVDEMTSVARCIELGAEDFLPKPFDVVLLNARVNACLEKKRLRDLELEYLRNVARLTEAAAAVESETFDPDGLTDVANRTDALGQLARVFQRMAREVAARQHRLEQQVQDLRIELDGARQQARLAEITETDSFRELQNQANALRKLMSDGSE